MGYAVVLGEALVDLLDAEHDGEPVYRQAVGGGPLNVAVAVARLGGDVQFVGSLGDDALAGRIRAFLTGAGVGVAGAVTVPAPTALAVATFAGPEPEFRFYGEPRSYALLGPDDLDVALVEGADVLYCGSIVLLDPPVLAAARRAWAVAGGLRVFDPNVRPSLLTAPDALDRLRGWSRSSPPGRTWSSSAAPTPGCSTRTSRSRASRRTCGNWARPPSWSRSARTAPSSPPPMTWYACPPRRSRRWTPPAPATR